MKNKFPDKKYQSCEDVDERKGRLETNQAFWGDTRKA